VLIGNVRINFPIVLFSYPVDNRKCWFLEKKDSTLVSVRICDYLGIYSKRKCQP